MLVNCYSNRDAIGNTVIPSYDASQKLVGFRIVGEGNIVNACKVSSYIPSMYWKPYEDVGNSNSVNITISSNTDFYMNPIDERDSWVTDLGIIEAIYKSDSSINTLLPLLNIYKKESLPSKFIVVSDFITDGMDLIKSGEESNVFCIDERLFLRLTYNQSDNTLTAVVLNSDFKTEVLSITSESFSHVKPIRLLYSQNGNRGALSLCYCKDSNNRYTVLKGNRSFSYTPSYTAKFLIFNGFSLGETDLEHTNIKRFLVGSGVEDNISLVNVNAPVKCENTFFSYDYRNKTSLEENIVKVIGSSATRPTGVHIGFQYFDTTLAKPIWWSGEQWIYSDGTVAH